MRSLKFLLLSSSLSILLSGCLSRLADIGKPPEISKIENPVEQKGYQPVNMPMPQVFNHTPQHNSLWQTGSRGFFKDQRATKVGDILTVLVSIQDKGVLKNKTIRNRESSMSMKTPQLFGFSPRNILPKKVNPTEPFGVTSAPKHTGDGSVDRNEEIKFKIAATVVQELPNGNLVIKGRQEVRVNFEVREIEINGLVRKSDILSNNTISYEKVAEARIIYGGRGQITDIQQAPYGQQVIDAIIPF